MRVFPSSMATSSTSGYAASHARSRASCHAPQADQSRRHITVPISITMLRLRSASGQPPGSMHAWPRRAAQAQEDIRVQRPDHRSPCTLSDQSQSREPHGPIVCRGNRNSAAPEDPPRAAFFNRCFQQRRSTRGAGQMRTSFAQCPDQCRLHRSVRILQYPVDMEIASSCAATRQSRTPVTLVVVPGRLIRKNDINCPNKPPFSIARSSRYPSPSA